MCVCVRVSTYTHQGVPPGGQPVPLSPAPLIQRGSLYVCLCVRMSTCTHQGVPSGRNPILSPAPPPPPRPSPTPPSLPRPRREGLFVCLSMCPFTLTKGFHLEVSLFFSQPAPAIARDFLFVCLCIRISTYTHQGAPPRGQPVLLSPAPLVERGFL